MSVAPVFDWACAELEDATSLNALESRGTVRIALKNAGLEARAVLAKEMKIVLNRVLPVELEARGVENAAELCAELVVRLARQDFESESRESADTIFARLGSRS